MHACIYRLNLTAKKKKKKNGKKSRIHKKLNHPKRFTDNVEKKIKDDLFFIKTIDLGRGGHTESFTGT